MCKIYFLSKNIIPYMAKINNDNLKNISELPEIIEQNEIINDLMKKILKSKKDIALNYELVKIAEQKILHFKKQKRKENFDYQPLINGKINEILIKTISVHGCQYLDNNQKCTGTHNIHIYGTTSKKRINFNNERKFSMNELVNLNYINKLEITVNEDCLSELLNNCELAKHYRNKIAVYCFCDDFNWYQ